MGRLYSLMKRILKGANHGADNSNPYLLPGNPQQEDIYLVEFPKSGVTYLGFLLGNIELLLDGKNHEQISFFNYSQYIPDVSLIGGMPIRRWARRTFIKSHEPFTPFYIHLIYLIRHPEDVMVSYYNYMRDEGLQATFLDFVASSKYGIRAWCNHVSSWVNNSSNARRIHLMRYEDLIQDPLTYLTELYHNLGVDVPESIIKTAIERSQLERMKQSEELYRKYHPTYRMNFVGKQGKIRKEELFSQFPDTRLLIHQEAEALLKRFYPES